MIFRSENEELLLLSNLANLNAKRKDQTFKTVCPHDCPSACGLEVALDKFGAITAVCVVVKSTATRMASFAQKLRGIKSVYIIPTD